MAFEDAARALRGLRAGGAVPGAPEIPVGEATELNGAAARQAVRSATGALPTPATAAGGSAEAQAFRTAQAANIGPQPMPGVRPQAPVGLADRLNGVASSIDAHGGATSASAGEALNGVRQAGQNAANVVKAGTNVIGSVLSHPVGRIAGGVVGGLDAIHQANEADANFAAGDTLGGVDRGVRAVGSALSMLPSPIGAVAGAYRVGNTVGDVIDGQLQKSEWGQGVREAGGRFLNNVARAFGGGVDDTAYRRGLGENVSARAPSVPAPQTPRPAAAAAPTTPVALQPTPQQTEAAAAPANVVTRNGNSFSGGTVREGFTYAGDGAPAGARGPIGVVPGYDASRDAATSAALRGQVEAQRTLDGFSAGPQGGGAGSFGQSLGRGTRAPGTDLSGYTPAELQFLSQQQGNETQRRGQDIQAAQSAAQLGQQRYSTDIGAAVSTRGQDMTSATARNAARIEQMQKDRTYQLDVAKFGHEQAAQNFNQREAADKNLTTQIEALNPGADGKPDANRVAADKTGIMRSVARMGLDGAHQLSPTDTQRLLTANQLLSTMRENGSNFLPWKPDLLKTIDPVDLTNLRVLPNGDRQITRADSKAAGQIIPKRFFDTEEGVRFFGGTPTNRYDILREARR